MPDSLNSQSPRSLLRAMFDAAIAAAQPAKQIASFLPAIPKGRTIVIGAGKASAAMAQAFEEAWQDRSPLEGLVVTRYGYEVPCQSIEIVQASHPVPDAAGEQGARRMLELVQGLTADDLVVCLISGGGSSLLALPLDGLQLEDKQTLNRQLLKSGASIQEMNCVRRHLSAIKGGRLAKACAPAKVLNLIISDVPGDAPADIASGPTVPDNTRCSDALAILERYRIEVPAHVREVLTSGRGESIASDDDSLPEIETHLIATPQQALEAAAKVAEQAGLPTYILGDAIEGEARDVAKALAGIALQVQRHGQPFSKPCVLLSGGETTVTLRGEGRGGRNVEFLLALAIALRASPNTYALAGDTDGVDGVEETAGAIITPDTLARAEAKGLLATKSLDNNDGHSFFESLNDAIVTGPTLTNVNDFRAIVIL